MGEDDFSWLMDTFPAGNSADDYSWLMGDGSGGLDPSLLPMMPTPEDQLYTPMEPFNPASPEYGNLAINFDGSSVPQLNLGGGSGGSSMSSLAKLFGFGGSGGGGASWLAPLLSLLGIGAGAYLNHNASTEGARQMSDAMNAANDKITGILGNSSAMYQPYADLGKQGVAALAAMPNSNITGNFRPLGVGRGLSATTLGQLAGH